MGDRGAGVSDFQAEASPSQVSLGGVLGSLREAGSPLRLPPPGPPLQDLVNNYLVTWGWNSGWGRGLFLTPFSHSEDFLLSVSHRGAHTFLGWKSREWRETGCRGAGWGQEGPASG